MNSITVRQLGLRNQQKICFIPIYFNLQVRIGALDLGQMKKQTVIELQVMLEHAVPKSEVKEKLHAVSFPVPTAHLPKCKQIKVVWNGVFLKVLS